MKLTNLCTRDIIKRLGFVEKTTPFSVSVLIPTYQRAYLLDHVLDALTKQNYKDFEVVIILKPSGDGTEDVIQKYSRLLNLNLVIQAKGYIVNALDLGLENASGDIIIFLDDDAIPFPNMVQTYLDTYTLPNVGGVAGDVIPAALTHCKILPFLEPSSELVPSCKPFMAMLARKLWLSPITGLEDNLVYLSKAGVVEYDYEIGQIAKGNLTKSLLGMGANMSILKKTVEDFRFPNSWIRGLSWEQFLGWYIHKKGYRLLFNPEIRVYHIHHGQTLSRNITEEKKEILRWTENNLLFYRLWNLEPDISKMHRLFWLLYETVVDVSKICRKKELTRLPRLKSRFYSEIIGLKWILSKKVKGNYNPLIDLEKLC